MGMICDVSAVSADYLEDIDPYELVDAPGTATATGVSLEKSWHGLHYLLTGEVWTGNEPLAFLLNGCGCAPRRFCLGPGWEVEMPRLDDFGVFVARARAISRALERRL